MAPGPGMCLPIPPPISHPYPATGFSQRRSADGNFALTLRAFSGVEWSLVWLIRSFEEWASRKG